MKKTPYIAFLLILAVFLAGQISRADTISDIQAKIDASNKNREALEKEIAGYQKQLDVVTTQATTLQNTIKSLDISTGKITTEVRLTENGINKTTLGIEETSIEINDKARKIDLGRQAIIKSLRQIERSDNTSTLEILFANNNISDFWQDLESTIDVQSKISKQVNEVRNIKISLEKAKAELEIKKEELESYTKELNGKKQALLSTKVQKSTLLTQTKNTEANYQKILKDKLALKEALDSEVAEYESQLRLAIDPTSFPKSGKGILTWPLDSILVTQNFGRTTDSIRLYASGTHNGTDFRAAIGTKVKSAGIGVVESIGNTDTVCPGASFGKWVFIRYDNGLASTYGHLSVISAVAGQKVKAGDIVGYSGNTGYSTGPHLHMSLYAGQGVKVTSLKSAVCKGTYTMPIADPKAYLDPLAYL